MRQKGQCPSRTDLHTASRTAPGPPLSTCRRALVETADTRARPSRPPAPSSPRAAGIWTPFLPSQFGTASDAAVRLASGARASGAPSVKEVQAAADLDLLCVGGHGGLEARGIPRLHKERLALAQPPPHVPVLPPTPAPCTSS